MAENDDDDGLRDYEYERTRAQQGFEHASLVDRGLADARKHLFAPIEITEGGRPRTTKAFAAFIDALTRDAVNGDANAIKTLDCLEQHFEKQRRLAHASAEQADNPVSVQKEKHRPIAAMGNNLCSVITLQMMPCFLQAYARAGIKVTPSAGLFPYYIDPTETVKAAALALRRWRKKQPRAEYVVGRGKPPVAGRFTSENNPHSKATSTYARDYFERSRTKPVVVTSADGSKVTSTRREITYAQMFRAAIRGRRWARTETAKIIIRLDEKGWLSPPERPRRSKRKPVEMSAQARMLVKVAEVMATPSVKHDMLEAFARRHGPIPPFTTAYERRLPALAEIEGWAEFQAERAEHKAQMAAEQQAAEKEAQREAQARSPPLPPTRMRTRSAPPAHSRHPTVPRAKVPVIKAPAVKTPSSRPPTPSGSKGKPRG